MSGLLPSFFVGRPTSLDDLTAKRIVDAVGRGLPRYTAARLARIAPSTLMLWLKKGREGDPTYSDFSDRVKEAEAQAEDVIVQKLRGLATESWQACAYLLAARNPKRWAARKIIDGQQVASAKPVETMQSREQQLAVLESLKAAVESAA